MIGITLLLLFLFFIIFLVPSSLFKTHDQFPSAEEYSLYVKDNICPGMYVVCCENCDDIRKGDTGKVTKVCKVQYMYSNLSIGDTIGTGHDVHVQ